MPRHIIFSAVGTSSSTQTNYRELGNRIATAFPDCTFHYHFTSPAARKKLAAEDPGELHTLVDTLELKANQPLILQSLHIIAGSEFHQLVRQATALDQSYQIGLPLLSEPADFEALSQCLEPVITTYPDLPLILLGHGTEHPSWSAYPTLENVLQNRYGKEIYVRGLEKNPRPETLLTQLKNRNITRVAVIPFLLVKGVHYQRDITGDHPTSWKNRLGNLGIEMIVHQDGLAHLNGIEDVYISHIKAAIKAALGRW